MATLVAAIIILQILSHPPPMAVRNLVPDLSKGAGDPVVVGVTVYVYVDRVVSKGLFNPHSWPVRCRLVILDRVRQTLVAHIHITVHHEARARKTPVALQARVVLTAAPGTPLGTAGLDAELK
jgi:hypothetical protein